MIEDGQRLTEGESSESDSYLKPVCIGLERYSAGRQCIKKSILWRNRGDRESVVVEGTAEQAGAEGVRIGMGRK